MRYMLLLTSENPTTSWNTPIGPQWEQFLHELTVNGVLIAAAELHDVEITTALQTRNQRRQIIDGTVDQTTANLIACVTIDADNLDIALEWAERAPTATTGAVEIRPLRN